MDYIRSKLKLLECNIDDMNPQLYPHLSNLLFAAGARDVWTTPIVMKAGRPGTLLSVLCSSEEEEKLADMIFRETTTIGLRVQEIERLELQRQEVFVSTQWGELPVKIAYGKDGEVLNNAPEYSACAETAQKHGIPVKTVINEVISRLAVRKD